MTKNQITAILNKFATVPNQSGTKKFIPSDKISEIVGEIMKLNKSSFIPPTLQEMSVYCKEKGYNIECAVKAYEYYTEMNWVDNNGKQVKSWKGKLISTWFRPEYKVTIEPENKMKGMVL